MQLYLAKMRNRTLWMHLCAENRVVDRLFIRPIIRCCYFETIEVISLTRNRRQKEWKSWSFSFLQAQRIKLETETRLARGHVHGIIGISTGGWALEGAERDEERRRKKKIDRHTHTQRGREERERGKGVRDRGRKGGKGKGERETYVSLISLIPRYARGENNYELAQYASSGGGGGGGTGHRNSRG